MKKLLIGLLAVGLVFGSFGTAQAGQILAGSKDVSSAGTPVALLSTRTFGRDIIVKADAANTGYIWIGDVNVLASTGVGIELDAGEVWIGNQFNLNQIYIDATVGGEGVGFTYRR